MNKTDRKKRLDLIMKLNELEKSLIDFLVKSGLSVFDRVFDFDIVMKRNILRMKIDENYGETDKLEVLDEELSKLKGEFGITDIHTIGMFFTVMNMKRERLMNMKGNRINAIS